MQPFLLPTLMSGFPISQDSFDSSLFLLFLCLGSLARGQSGFEIGGDLYGVVGGRGGG